jgi:nicotinate-nucleotide adenylyltransferase
MKVEVIETAILGGTFDPIHEGHLAMAHDILERELAQEVIFVPSARPPHKSGKKITPAKERMKMLELAIAGEERFSISDYEIENNYRESYTVHTLNALKSAMPSRRFKLVIGMDNLHIFHTWYNAREIIQNFPIIVYGRPGSRKMAEVHLIENFNQRMSTRLSKSIVEDGPMNDISATEIRRRTAEGEKIDHLVPGAVAEYIKEKGFYT